MKIEICPPKNDKCTRDQLTNGHIYEIVKSPQPSDVNWGKGKRIAFIHSRIHGLDGNHYPISEVSTEFLFAHIKPIERIIFE